jgi:enoyl-CoA hydratase/methylglutaconyl-CoA hydratase
VHGSVRSGGIAIVAAADIALTADDATYAFTEVRLGLVPAAVSLTVLPRLTDRAAALAFLTGDVFDGREAERTGLVTRAVPEQELDGVVAEVCGSLGRGTTQGLREAKRLVAGHLVERIDRQGPELAALSARLFGSAQARAAMSAFLDRSR